MKLNKKELQKLSDTQIKDLRAQISNEEDRRVSIECDKLHYNAQQLEGKCFVTVEKYRGRKWNRYTKILQATEFGWARVLTFEQQRTDSKFIPKSLRMTEEEINLKNFDMSNEIPRLDFQVEVVVAVNKRLHYE